MRGGVLPPTLFLSPLPPPVSSLFASVRRFRLHFPYSLVVARGGRLVRACHALLRSQVVFASELQRTTHTLAAPPNRMQAKMPGNARLSAEYYGSISRAVAIIGACNRVDPF
jgi:hypothetical protein